MDPIVAPEPSILNELEAQRPTRRPVALLSQNERHRIMERSFHGLYRWYVDRSQQTRDWSPDRSFDWRNLRKDHSDEVFTILEGFYAVEQYVPDYVLHGINMLRESYGRSQFHLRWGSEEEKHADLWRNAVLFGGRRDAEWMENYTDQLRGQQWQLPWEDPMHIIFYTVFQERATQLNYINLGLVAKGQLEHEVFVDEVDPVLAAACRTIAIDEAAHYNFFLEGARLYLYYFPEEAVAAMADVLRHFSMPARDIIPDYDKFGEILHRTAIFGLRQHQRDVVRVALNNLGAENLRKVEDGIRRSREIPDENGTMRTSAIFETIDHEFIETRIKQMHGKVASYEAEIGFDEVSPTKFVPNPIWPSQQANDTAAAE
jgi:acyl-[acyl-carrier-protein] desaturase